MATIDIKKMHLYNNQVKMNSKTLLSSASDQKIQTKREAQISLLLGGSKCGKSSYAYDYALGYGLNNDQRTIIATSKERVNEITKKTMSINSTNEKSFTIIEDGMDIDKTLENLSPKTQIVIIDNIFAWISNLLKSGEDVEKRLDHFLTLLTKSKQDIVIVSNMIGFNLIEESSKGNKVVEISGIFNQKLAAISTNVILIVAGLPMKIKGDLL
ncbi:MAG: bifunctional adenosylcobinamide kinase/adenosylcobinamide-phosphate guanylyltransferase [Sphaerochaetaceae bacterium]|nr:bifunctional adenosylcobinamide kinase/adenosylcobinamide-phosphate guanylyltransferase [Sphaerochaetaceae bacterium]MDC7250536.1 bifunctional adenosylcobinamide kinase/adenosylcobinamide-phosphate guanylyltransferase [Sphaerochaetaceae bacterium]